jgi:tetratricopeptide (TPR) repeat protein
VKPVDEVAKFHFNEGIRYSLQAETHACALNFRQSMESASNAVTEYNFALQIDPDNLVILQTKGVALKQQGELLEAADIFEALIEAEPDQSENYYQLSLCFFEHAIYDSGIDTFNEALAISKSPTLNNRLVSDLEYIALKWMYFAHDCLNMGQPEAFNHFANDALNIVEIGLRFDPSNNGLNRLHGLILTDLKQIKNAN